MTAANRDWSKHLRRWGKRLFWKRERRAARMSVNGWVHHVPDKDRAAVHFVGDY